MKRKLEEGQREEREHPEKKRVHLLTQALKILESDHSPHISSDASLFKPVTTISKNISFDSSLAKPATDISSNRPPAKPVTKPVTNASEIIPPDRPPESKNHQHLQSYNPACESAATGVFIRDAERTKRSHAAKTIPPDRPVTHSPPISTASSNSTKSIDTAPTCDRGNPQLQAGQYTGYSKLIQPDNAMKPASKRVKPSKHVKSVRDKGILSSRHGMQTSEYPPTREMKSLRELKTVRDDSKYSDSKHSDSKQLDSKQPIVEEEKRKDIESELVREFSKFLSLRHHGPDLTHAVWNVNGLVNLHRKGYLGAFLTKHSPDIICISELKCSMKNILKHHGLHAILYSFGYEHVYLHPMTRDNQGHHGTAIISKVRPLRVFQGWLHTDELDDEGRVLTAVFEKHILCQVYSPCSAWPERKMSQEQRRAKDEKRKRFDIMLREHLDTAHSVFTRPVVLVGDLNVSPTDLDVWDGHWNTRRKFYPGCKPFEQNAFQLLTSEQGFSDRSGIRLQDAYRFHHPQPTNLDFTWHRNQGVFKSVDNLKIGRGHRLDHVLSSPELLKPLRRCIDPFISEIRNDQSVKGSDHTCLFFTLKNAAGDTSTSHLETKDSKGCEAIAQHPNASASQLYMSPIRKSSPPTEPIGLLGPLSHPKTSALNLTHSARYLPDLRDP